MSTEELVKKLQEAASNYYKKEKEMHTTLSDLLLEISVLFPDCKDKNTPNWPKDWYAICDHTGIIAYFARESDAFGFRLSLINLRLNGMKTLTYYKKSSKKFS